MRTDVVDILDPDFYGDGLYGRLADLRDHHPIAWDATNELWVVSRYDDVVDIERNKVVFSNEGNEKGGYRPNIPADASIIGLDDPVHHARRYLVARRFTPKGVTKFEDHVSSAVTGLLDDALARGTVEVVADLAAPLPAMMICSLLGFGDDMWPQLQDWATRTVALGGGPRYYDEDGIAAAFEFAGACAELHATKQGCPADDIVSHYVAVERETGGEVGGRPFGVDEVISDSLLLLDGGAETTRTVIARILLELADRPATWAALKAGADLDLAVEEFIRWVTPIHNMCRVAVADHDLHGETIRAGEQVILMYNAANRDPGHFDRPEEFDIGRSPNKHLAFGFGTHLCLGAPLARLEIHEFFRQLLERVERVERIDGDPDRPHVDTPNAFVNGIGESWVTLVPTG